MREKVKLFLDEFIQTMPQYYEFVRDEIIGWLGFIDEEDVKFTHSFREDYEYDEYISLYKQFHVTISDRINNLEIVKNLPTYSITAGVQYLEEDKLSVLIDSMVDHFIVQDEYGTMLVPQEDAEMFFSIYDRYYS